MLFMIKNKKTYLIISVVVLLLGVLFFVRKQDKLTFVRDHSDSDALSQICHMTWPTDSKPTVYVMKNQEGVTGGYYVVVANGARDISLYLYDTSNNQIAHTNSSDTSEIKNAFMKSYNELSAVYNKKKIGCE